MSFLKRPNESPLRASLFWASALFLSAGMAVLLHVIHDLLPWHPYITVGAFMAIAAGERFLQLDEPR